MISLLIAVWLAAEPPVFSVSDSLFTSIGILQLSDRDGWTYHPADDPAFADPGFDDSLWHRVSPAQIRLDRDAPDSLKWHGSGWFRFRFTLDSTLTDIPLFWRIGTWGALSVYLDGVYQTSFGRPHSDPDSVINYHPLNRIAHAPRTPVVPGRTYLLAIRYVNHVEPLTYNWLNTPLDIDPLVRLAKPDYSHYIIGLKERNLMFNMTWIGTLVLLTLLFILFWFLDRSNRLIGSTVVFTSLLLLAQLANSLPGMLQSGHVAYLLTRMLFQLSIGLAVPVMAILMSHVIGVKPPRLAYWLMGVWLLVMTVLFTAQGPFGQVGIALYVLSVAVLIGWIVYRGWGRLKHDGWMILTGILLVSANILVAIFTEQVAWYQNSALIQFLNVSLIYLSIPIAMLLHITLNYTRLNRERNQRLEKEVAEATAHLTATMAQLVQQEKLASLGQLTAGIAHEIKNPLNFVNNFASVSVELVAEAKEEVDRLASTFNLQPSTLKETLGDIDQNLHKIVEHGSRADKIVKSMLLHSRGGSGKMEPTDINALVQEYANLAFHGMRAAKNPITVDIRYELDPAAGSIPLVAEDFSRVILNLCNNAFDAMRTENRQPKTDNILILRTKRTPAALLIEVEDNGHGIPEEIKSRILEPFFTTKKGTEGTGLGLSISVDIITAHRGELRIEDAVQGARFVISLQS